MKHESALKIKEALQNLEQLGPFLDEDVLKSEKYYTLKYALEDNLKKSKNDLSELGQARIDKVLPVWRYALKPGVFIKIKQVVDEMPPLIEVANKTLEELEDTAVNLPQHFSPGEPYSARTALRGILSSAKSSITMVDTYLHPDTLAILVGCMNLDAPQKIQLVTSTNNPRLKAVLVELTAMVTQYPSLSVTLSSYNTIHDRYLLIDDSTYHSGQSFHDLGIKAGRVSRENNTAQIKKIKTDISDAISSGKKEF